MFIFRKEKAPAEPAWKPSLLVAWRNEIRPIRSTRQGGEGGPSPPYPALIRGAVRGIRQGDRPRLEASRPRRPVVLAGGTDSPVRHDRHGPAGHTPHPAGPSRNSWPRVVMACDSVLGGRKN